MADKLFTENSRILDETYPKNFLKAQKINEPTVG